ncbi:MAG: 1-acyl-sn-glycerol-3-phosphate acyltransferase [Anaerolineae bacterium]|nr:1-acyl-sn-glycerol-3-phosphate acyltransferase [Anaerolineae bacterium]
MTNNTTNIHYPRRTVLRWVLRAAIAHPLTYGLTRFNIEGRENLPEKGPLILAANHFFYVDPVFVIGATPYYLDFLAGTINPGSPRAVQFLTTWWGVFRVARGTASTTALKKALSVLKQDGIIGIFPEGGTWARVLRPPRPGVAFLAAQSNARIVPIGLINMENVFVKLRQGKREKVTVRIGKPFGPYSTSGSGRERRRQLDEIGHDIMHHIAELLPPEQRGCYSDDPAIREAAREAAIYPWAEATEDEMTFGEHLREKRKEERLKKQQQQG